jgi:hypothetical protein
MKGVIRMNLVFRWVKPQAGYEWANCKFVGNLTFDRDSVKIPNPPYLVEKDRSRGRELLTPFEDTSLFARFADMTPDAESFETWASTYGMLVGGERMQSGETLCVLSDKDLALGKAAPYGFTVTLPDGSCGPVQCSESQEFWIKEHRDLAFTVMVWELTMRKDVERLGKIIYWTAENTSVCVRRIEKASLDKLDVTKPAGVESPLKQGVYGGEVIFNNINTRSWASELYMYPDIIGPALLFVQKSINEKLQEYPVNVVLQIDEQGKLHQKLNPSSLLSAMWYQFHLVLAGEERVRRCDICGQWENMRGHRGNWRVHPRCANKERVTHFRKK